MIRKATKEDLDAMMEVVLTISSSDKEMLERIRYNFEQAFIEHKLAPVYFLYICEDKVVGIGGVTQVPINYRSYGFHSLWVHKDFQGRGFAKQLVHKRIEYVKSLRRHEKDDYIIFLSTLIPDFFTKLGFEKLTQFNVNGSQVMMLRV